MAKVFFVTGKGGTGKTSLSQSVALKYSSQKKKVLLIRIDSFSLSQEGDNKAHKVNDFFWEQKLYVRKVVEEYFSTTLARLPLPGVFQKIAGKIQEGIAHKLLANRFVMKFVEACPGLIPTIFLGKICWEYKNGGPAQSDGRWDIVIVDAPSTGQALQIFDSAKTLSKVLSQGLVQRHILETLNFAYSPDFQIQILTVPEEGPLQECLEMIDKFQKLGLKISHVWINKVSPSSESQRLESVSSEDPLVKKAIEIELDRVKDQRALIQDFEKKLSVPYSEIAEHLVGEALSIEVSL